MATALFVILLLSMTFVVLYFLCNVHFRLERDLSQEYEDLAATKRRLKSDDSLCLWEDEKGNLLYECDRCGYMDLPKSKVLCPECGKGWMMTTVRRLRVGEEYEE